MEAINVESILFPHHAIRPVQDVFINDIIDALEKKQHIIAHAPTGLGKTSILGPVLSYALKNNKTVFFITPRHTQHKIAVETLKLIKEKYKLSFNATDLIGKRWMCRQPGISALSPSEFSEYCKELVSKGNCEFYANVFKGLNTTVQAKIILNQLKLQNPLDAESVCKISGDANLCPYEMSLLLSRKSSVIIGDYLHILNKSIRDSLFGKANKSLDKSIIIFDEAHNLPDKARDLLSVNLSTFTLNAAIREAEAMGFSEISTKLKDAGNILIRLGKNKLSVDVDEALVNKDDFAPENYSIMIKELILASETAIEVKKKSFMLSLLGFLTAWPGEDIGFTRIIRRGFLKSGKPTLILTYKCMDPAFLLRPIADEAQIICMSGTLLPTKMYEDLFGFTAVLKEYDDPFPKINRLNLIVPKTTTKFTARGAEMYHKIAALSSSMINAIKGNCFMFFPSYQIRDDVYEYLKTLANKTIFLEQQGLSKEEKGNIIERFKSYKETGALLLGATSGSFAEGIDLPGDFLKAVIIVGLPLSKPDLETQELIRYYEERFKQGWNYGYIYPAMIKTIQGAGRCIRSKDDKGVIVFLDERYTWKNYFKCFPKDWQLKISSSPVAEITEFLSKQAE